MTRAIIRRLLGGGSTAKQAKPAKAKSGKDRITYTGDYGSWEAARAASSGYEAANILETVRTSAAKARDGLAAFERDGVAFDRPEYRWPMLACLMWARAQTQGRFHVVDFGGSLGSVYFQHRVFLDALPELLWSVVEQPHYVEVGRREFQVGSLAFFETLELAAQRAPIDAVLLSGVLQSMSDPYGLLADAASAANIVIIDRTPVIAGDQDKLVVQTVPAHIYPASYPHWFLAADRLTDTLASYGFVSVGPSVRQAAEATDQARPHRNYPTFLFTRKQA